LRAAFFSCFSLSWAAKISIWVGGLFSRFCAFPLLRIPWPNSTPCCGGKREKKRKRVSQWRSEGDKPSVVRPSRGGIGAKTGGDGMKLKGSAHLVGHLRLVGVEELAAAEELVDHHVLLGVLDARVEVEGGVKGEGLVGDDINGTHLACSSCWGL